MQNQTPFAQSPSLISAGPPRPAGWRLFGLALLAAWIGGTAAFAAGGSSGVQLTPIGTYAASKAFKDGTNRVFELAAAEIVAHDPVMQRLFVVNALAAEVEVLNIRNPHYPVRINTLNLLPYGGVANSVAWHGGVLAVAVEDAVKTNPGRVVFFDSRTLLPLSAVQVGALPDMLTFSPDGRWVLVANEGEPSTDYTVDPHGSVSIIDVSGGARNVTQANVRTVDFTAFNEAALDPSIRIFGPGATVAQDLEPEYIAVSPDSTTAWVTLQENNAIAIIDIAGAQVLNLAGLGFKDHSVEGNGLDASDRDGGINIQPWPLKGVYMPDAIAAFAHGDSTLVVMANEGDSRDYEAFAEEVRIGALTLSATAFPDQSITNNNQLGRLRVTSTLGQNADGEYEELYSFGARSFSIRTAAGALVFDSGDQLEQITAACFPANFNASHTSNSLDNRSTAKGPEPEGLVVGEAFGRTLVFIGLERISGVVTYDISDPLAPVLMDYVNNRDFSVAPVLLAAGDLGPEGLAFIRAENSPNGKPLLVVGNEVSGTTTIYEISETP